MAIGSSTEVVSSAGQALRDLASSLMSIERQPLFDLQARQQNLSAQRDAYRSLGTKLSSLRRLAQEFAAPGSLSALRTMKVGDLADAPFHASARFTASAGRHDIQVLQLAANHGVASGTLLGGESTLAGNFAPGEAQTFRFQIVVGEISREVSFTVESGATDGDVLTAAAEAIRASGAGVQASVLSVGQGNRRLLLQSEIGGEAGRIQSISDIEGGLMARLGLTSLGSNDSFGSATVVAPSDAVVLFDGVEIRSESNTLTDVIPGVTISLTSTSDSSQVLSIERNADASVEKLQSLLSAFNATLDEVYAWTRPADEESGQARGILAGSSGLGNFRNSLRALVGQSYSTQDSTLGRLADLGISADRQGRLTLKEAEFRQVLQSDPEAVEELFNGENGLAVQIDAFLDRYLKTGGVFDRQQEAAQSRIDLYGRRITSTEEGLAVREKSLLQQLAQMQAAIGALTQQQSYLGSLFSA